MKWVAIWCGVEVVVFVLVRNWKVRGSGNRDIKAVSVNCDKAQATRILETQVKVTGVKGGVVFRMVYCITVKGNIAVGAVKQKDRADMSM